MDIFLKRGNESIRPDPDGGSGGPGGIREAPDPDGGSGGPGG